jgi:hypothetical protein
MIRPILSISAVDEGTIRVSITNSDPQATAALYWCVADADVSGYSGSFGAGVSGDLISHDFAVNGVYHVKARFTGGAEESLDSDIHLVDASQGTVAYSAEVLQDIFMDLAAMVCVDFSRSLQAEKTIPFDAQKALIAERLFAVDYLNKIFLEAGMSADSLKRLIADAESPYEIFFRVITIVRDALASVDWRKLDVAREALAAADWRAALYRESLANINESIRAILERELQVDILKNLILAPDIPVNEILTIAGEPLLMVRFDGIAVTELMADALVQVSWSARAIAESEFPVSRAKVIVANGETAIEWLLNISVVQDADLAVDILKKIFSDAGLVLEYNGIKGSFIRLTITMLQPAASVAMIKPECSVTMKKATCKVTMVK